MRYVVAVVFFFFVFAFLDFDREGGWHVRKGFVSHGLMWVEGEV